MIDSSTLDHLPTSPGVYIFRDGEGEALYIGKAKSLRARVRSYFRTDAGHGIRTRELARRAEAVETIVVSSEAEALLLESNLIKEHRPRFNIRLRDDKRYPFIKVTVQEPFPRVFVTRRVTRDGARYFGPYTDVGPMRQALDVVKRLYTVRSCRYNLPKESPPRPCLDYHIGRCRAPCVGDQTAEEYREMIEEILRILQGDTGELKSEVLERMKGAARELRYEDAARHRDVLRGLESMERNSLVERVDGGDQDVIGLARDGDMGAAVILRIRRGTLLGREDRRFEGIGDAEEEEILSEFMSRYYLGGGEQQVQELPREILVPAEFGDRHLLTSVLSERAGHGVKLRVPHRGEKRRLVELAAANARHLLEERVTALEVAADRADAVLYELQNRLDLKAVPRLIACFDVSHTQGSDVVASAVLFENGERKRGLYRRMKIRGEWGNDDYRSMAEAVERYLTRRIAQEEPLPELLLVDGGKGQLSSVLSVLERVGAEEVALAAIAKREEEVFRPGRPDPIILSRRDPALRLLQRIRNEAHRFAVEYNRKLRGKRTIRSALGDIPGIGPGRQRALLTRFGSVKGVRKAGVDGIASVPGFSRVLAERVLRYLEDPPAGEPSGADIPPQENGEPGVEA